MNRRFAYYCVWILIFCIGSILRVYDLSGTPPGFFADEAAMGLDAYSLLTTGKSAHGVSFPLFFEQFEIYVGPLLTYSMVPFFFVFGPTVQAARLTAAMVSIGTLVLVWAIGRVVFPNRRIVPLCLFLIVACAPWGIKTGRVAGLSSVYTFFFSLTLLLFFLSKRRIWAYLATWAAAGIAAYAYFSAYIQMPFVVMGMIATAKPLRLHLRFLGGILLIIAITTPLMLHILSGKGTNRLRQIGGITTTTIGQKYLDHFLPQFLFTKGDGFYRNEVHGFGLLYPHDALLFSVGILTVLYTRQWFLLWCLFVVYPLPGILTADGVSEIRSIAGYIIVPLVMAYGAATILQGMKRSPYRRIVTTMLCCAYLLCTGYQTITFAKEYFFRFSSYASGYYGWQYGVSQILLTVTPLSSAYEEVLITHQFNGSEEVLTFHKLAMPCPNCHIMTNPITIDPEKTQLFVLRNSDVLEAGDLYPTLTFQHTATVYLPHGQPEYFIGRFTPKL